MCGSGVQIRMVRTAAQHRQILEVPGNRPIFTVVFAAVRGTAAIRTSSGALIVAGATKVSGTTASASVFPQDRARILFSGAAFSGPFSGSGL